MKEQETTPLQEAAPSAAAVPRPGSRPSDSHYAQRRRSTVTLLEAHDAPRNPTKYHIALPVILGDIANPDIPPVLYLKAAGESLFLTLLISWIITFIFRPDVILDNPLKARLGYNNLCVGWDVAPANYVAAVLWIWVAYLCLRFTTMNAIRFQLIREPRFWAGLANLAFSVGVCAFTLCLMIPPDFSVWYHTLPFIGYIVTRYLVVLALSFEDYHEMPHKTRIFLWVYGFISATLPIIYLSEYAYYERHHETKSPWPWQITFVLDYGWFACLAVTSKFIPSNIIIHREFKLVELKENGTALALESIA